MNANEILKNALNILERELEVNEGEAPPVMLSCINLSEFIFQSCFLKLSLVIFAIVHGIPIFWKVDTLTKFWPYVPTYLRKV